VAFSGRIGGVWVVSLRHPDGLETTYEPVQPAVRAGAQVHPGTVLGRVGTGGGHCLPAACLHWGLRRAGTYLDPLLLVGAAQVRLLPMLTSRSAASWLVPAAGGASVGSSAVVLGWALASTRRRRRRLPPGVTSLTGARADRRRSAQLDERTPAG
jgi:murein DD-endopeptidase MepM/ murein hydrolase activator NlpD